MLLASGQIHRPLEWHWESRNTLTVRVHCFMGMLQQSSRENRLFNKWCWDTWTVTCQRINLSFFLTPCKKFWCKMNSMPLKFLYFCYMEVPYDSFSLIYFYYKETYKFLLLQVKAFLLKLLHSSLIGPLRWRNLFIFNILTNL